MLISYKALSKPGEATVIEKKSRFIAFARPISTEGDAEAFLAELRKKYWDASHHVYAYILQDCAGGAARRRQSDDGEPSGSAGAPILEVLAGAGLVNVIVVVIRYFGGTLLGVGGLLRTYSAAAKAAILEAGTIEMKLCREYSLELSYPAWNRVKNMTKGYHAASVVYGERITVQFLVEVAMVPAFEALITDATGGLSSAGAKLVILGEGFYSTLRIQSYNK